MNADVERDVRVRVLDLHGLWSVDIDNLVVGWFIRMTGGHAEDVVVRHVEADGNADF